MKDYPVMLVAKNNGEIIDVPCVQSAGMKAGHYFCMDSRELIQLPEYSDLFVLKDRTPIGYDRAKKRFTAVNNAFPVAAFLSPGYTVTYNTAYKEKGKTNKLPLFSYGAVSLYKDKFYTAAVRTDREARQNLGRMDINKIKENAGKLKKKFRKNRLFQHLKKCALVYSCPAAKNFFLSRYEAPLPSSPYCNARCLGCLSYQKKGECPATQPRIDFVPTAGEIAEIALYHIKNTNDPVVSFGQGCEGEPLLVGNVIAGAIRLIRAKTRKGIININTNASKIDVIDKLLDSGLDSMRVSVNSVQERYYDAYYKPEDYCYKDVLTSIKKAKGRGCFISVNYLVMPGFADNRAELKCFLNFIKKYKIDMVQWRNLNYDPIKYYDEINYTCRENELVGIDYVINKTKKTFPWLIYGYFNPSKNRIRRMRKGK